MSMVEVADWKQIECDKCGYVSSVVKWIPLSLTCCSVCGSLKIRLYFTEEQRKKRNKRRAERLPK